jgi:hypothetical protein
LKTSTKNIIFESGLYGWTIDWVAGSFLSKLNTQNIGSNATPINQLYCTKPNINFSTLGNGVSCFDFNVHRAFNIIRIGADAASANLCLNSLVGGNAWGVSYLGEQIVDFGTGGAIQVYKSLILASSNPRIRSDGNLWFQSNGGNDRWLINTSGHIRPASNDTYNIGEDLNRVRYLIGRGVILNNSEGVFLREIDGTNRQSLYIDGSNHLLVRGQSRVNFMVGGTTRWLVNDSGHFAPLANISYDIGGTSNRIRNLYVSSFNVTGSIVNTTQVHIENTYSSYTGSSAHQLWMKVNRTPSSGFDFIRTNTGSRIEHRLRGDGNGLCQGSWTGGGADYGEYFEVYDINESIPIGSTVVLDNLHPGMIRKSTVDDPTNSILGVTRPKPKDGLSSQCGNHPLNWPYMYQVDEVGNFILDEYGERVVNPDYDAEQEYATREFRDEWYVVGLLGQVPILKGEAVNPNWVKIKDISETTELWLIK